MLDFIYNNRDVFIKCESEDVNTSKTGSSRFVVVIEAETYNYYQSIHPLSSFLYFVAFFKKMPALLYIYQRLILHLLTMAILLSSHCNIMCHKVLSTETTQILLHCSAQKLLKSKCWICESTLNINLFVIIWADSIPSVFCCRK